MYRIVVDKGTSRSYSTVYSEWSAKYICKQNRMIAKHRGDTETKFYYEKGYYDPATNVWKAEERSEAF